jgi:hypothetical protein
MRGFQWLKRRRPAPGTVLGLIALIVALAGTAVAGPLATTSVLDKKDKKQIRKIARAEIAKAAPGLTVGNAANAAQAGNAGTVDGRDATCPAGTFLQGGACFDTAVRFATSDWTFAATSCADAGGYLPSPSELTAIRGVAGIDLGAAGAGHWTDSRSDDGGINESMTALDNGTFESEAVGNLQPVRCAFRLLR